MEKYVDNVYLINMDKDTERLEKVTKECKKFNINFERFCGVDPLKISKKELNKYVSKTCQNICPNGIIGCGISHMKIYEDALKNNYKNILVLEDDVYFDDELYEELNKAMTELPEDYDILYLGCFGICDKEQVYNMDLNLLFHLYTNFLSKFKSTCKNECEKKLNNKYKYIHIPEFPLSAHGLIISNKGCRKLLNLIEKLNYHIDTTIALKSNELNIYITKKRLIYQTWNDSKNSSMSSNYLLNNNNNNSNIPPYSYIFNSYVIKIFNINITVSNIIFFLLGIFSYINKYLFMFILAFLIINQNTSILISYLIGYLIIYIIFNLNNRNLYNLKIKI
jgi:GR25 family glycosyltransferase involved in LPS biosynthesis